MKEEQGMYLNELNIYVIYLLNFIWDKPNLAVILLQNADIIDIKSNLAPFFFIFFF